MRGCDAELGLLELLELLDLAPDERGECDERRLSARRASSEPHPTPQPAASSQQAAGASALVGVNTDLESSKKVLVSRV